MEALPETLRSESGYTPGGLILGLITAITALGSISVSIYLPSLPSLATAIHASSSMVKLSLGVFLAVFAASQLVYGPLSERFGRKPPIVIGLLIYVMGSVACACASNGSSLLVARVVQGIGAAAGPALGRAILRDLYSESRLRTSLAVVAATVALSPMLGPVAGGYLQIEFGWRSCFVCLSVAGLALELAVLRWLPETNGHVSADALKVSRIIGAYRSLLGDQEFSAAVLCGGLLTAGNFAWTAGAPFIFASAYHLRPDQYGNIALIVGGGYVLGTLVSAQISKRLSAPIVVYGGAFTSLGAALAMWNLSGEGPNFSAPLVSIVFFTAGMGIVMPMSAACALSRHAEMAGSAAGLLGATQIMTGALETLAVSITARPGIPLLAEILTATSMTAVLAAHIALRPFGKAIVSVDAAAL